VFIQSRDEWRKADQVPELRMFFKDTQSRPAPAYDTELTTQAPGLKPGSLRRIKVLATLADDQLARLLKYMELKQVKQFEHVVRKGDPGDAMIFLLQGEMRVSVVIEGKETLLASLAAGDFFGDISLFDHGPRSANVIANEDCVLIRLSAAAVQKMLDKSPDIAAPFLFAIGKTLTTRIRANNKRFTETVAFARLGAEVRE
jgi:CRP-like cAMP-binding protein